MNHQPKILIVDDEVQIRRLLNLTLSSKGFKVIEAINGREGIGFASANRPELILLDIGLPDILGLEVLKEIRKFSDIPIIVLSVQDESDVIVAALDLGADDYVTKPFAPRELVARMNVCLRRRLKQDHAEDVMEFKNLKIDFSSRIVLKNGQEVKLTSTEYDLLKLFFKNPNKILTTRQILKDVWGPGSLENTQYPRVYVRHLRQKLEDHPEEPTFIITEAGVGYRLKLE